MSTVVMQPGGPGGGAVPKARLRKLVYGKGEEDELNEGSNCVNVGEANKIFYHTRLTAADENT